MTVFFLLLFFVVGGALGYVVAMTLVLRSLVRTTRDIIAENTQAMGGVTQALLDVMTELRDKTDKRPVPDAGKLQEPPLEVPLR